jgi:hypothetical protein
MSSTAAARRRRAVAVWANPKRKAGLLAVCLIHIDAFTATNSISGGSDV